MNEIATNDTPAVKPQKVVIKATGSPSPRDIRDAERIFSQITDPSASAPISQIAHACRDLKGVLHFAKVGKERVAAAQLNFCFEEMGKAKANGLRDIWDNLSNHYRMIELVATEPEYQGQGIAANLVQWIENNARSRGIKYLVAVVETEASSIGFFESQGFDVQPPGEPLYVHGTGQRRAPFTIESDYRWVVKELPERD